MSDPSIYLAGPVQHRSDGGASWRNSVIKTHTDNPIEFYNPLSKYNIPATNIEVVADNAGAGEVTPTGIVEADKELLRKSDAVLVGYSPVRSIGTPMEVMWAFERSKPIAIWIRDDTDIGELSPWYRYHADGIYYEAKEAIAGLESAVK